DNPEMTQDLLDQAREKMRTNGVVGQSGVGAMTDARWKTFFDMASSHGVYPKTLDYKRGYTLQFATP
ncbi:MAG: nitrate transporter substrate-binding protein, partial [Brevundimonas sp.]|nr:nitrate transporter substrate-binding protein [Brevundimonas sp.]